MHMQAIQAYIQQHGEQILEDVKALVRCESPTTDKALADACARAITQLVESRLGVPATVYAQPQRGDHVCFTMGEGEEQILLLCHYDTVWDEGRLPLRQEGDRLYGPGVLDMKSGLVACIWAMKACQALNLPHKKLCLLCTSDEEVGSQTSRALIEQIAKQSVAVLCAEPAEAVTGNLKTARKGTSAYTMQIYGKAAHAGNDPQGGVSAVEEMARQILYLHGLTDFERGTTVNAGVAHGGSRPNIIAEHAMLEIDVRTWTVEEAQRIDALIRGRKPTREGLRIEVQGGIGRPPLELTPRNRALFERAQACARALGLALSGSAVGGGSDGNFTSALGVPTLDGLGAVGDGPHAEREHIEVSKFLPRVTLLAGLLTSL